MSKKPDAGKLMYDRAIKDYGEYLIKNLIQLCIEVRRDNGLQENESPWTINGLLKYLGNELENIYDKTYP